MMLKAPRTPNTFCFRVLIWVEHVCGEKEFFSSAFEETRCLASPRKKSQSKGCEFIAFTPAYCLLNWSDAFTYDTS